jgi:hypothetical protein
MDLKKLAVDWKRVLITACVVLLSALVVGGTTWYVMDKSANEVDTANKATAEELQTQIALLEQEAVIEPVTGAAETPDSTTPSAATGLSTLVDYCTTANDGLLLLGYSYMKTANGEYANCGIGDPETGGAFLIAKFKNGAWTKLWAGNGVIEDTVCDADKIPNKMSGDTCKY